MIIKSYLLENNIKSISQHKMFLFYGENHGFKKEIKEKIKQANIKTETLNFFQDEIIKKNDLLLNEINNKSLFNEKKIIFINNANDKILENIENIIDKIDFEQIILFAEILDKKSKLRNFFEKSKICGTVACYEDNEITLRKIINEKLNGYFGVTPQLINLLIENANLDRNKVNNEIEKIQSCFSDKKIDQDKIEILLNIKTNDDFNKLKDVALIGNKTKTNKLITDTVFEMENNIYYLNTINQRINKLNEIENLKKKTQNIETVINKLKPPVFWKDKSMLIEQAKKWNKKKIEQALKKTYSTEIEIKSNSSIKRDLLIKNLLVDLCLIANAS